MASRMLVRLSSLAGRAARCSPPACSSHANAAVSLTQAAFTSAVNDADAGRRRTGRGRQPAGDEPVSPAAEKTTGVGGKVRDAAEEAKEAGRDVKDRAKEDVKESVKETR